MIRKVLRKCYAINISLFGLGLLFTFLVLPSPGFSQHLTFETSTVIDFGTVRLKDSSQVRDSSVTISNTDTNELHVLSISKLKFDSTLPLGPWKAIADKYQFLAKEKGTVVISFNPKVPGYYKQFLTIVSNDPFREVTNFAVVEVRGRCIAPKIVADTDAIAVDTITNTDGFRDFGFVKVGQRSNTLRATVQNIGDDTITIKSVKLLGALNYKDFKIVDPTIPTKANPFWLDTLKSQRSDTSFEIEFIPTSPGDKTAYIEVTAEGQLPRLIRLSGRGTAKDIVSDSTTVDFGLMEATRIGESDSIKRSSFHIHNSTSTPLGLDSLVVGPMYKEDTLYIGESNFRIGKALGDSRPIQADSVLFGRPVIDSVFFYVRQPGDYRQVIYLKNGAKNDTLVVLRASVRAPRHDFSGDSSFGVVADCDPREITYVIHNPYQRAGITIDKLQLAGNTGGFKIVTRPEFLFPLRIEGDSTFTFSLQYDFPPDSLNGEQELLLSFFQNPGGKDTNIRFDHPVSLTRQIKIDTLLTVAPSFVPSAGDFAPFRLPIYLAGPHEGLTPLDNWTLHLRFSNPLFHPVGIDRTGSLTESNGNDNSEVTWGWDETTQTDTIRAANLRISKDKSKNRLLLTVLMRAYVSLDTLSSVQLQLNTDEQLCAYRIASVMDSLAYANDCGDILIRAQMNGAKLPLRIGTPRYRLAANGSTETILIDYTAESAMTVEVANRDLMGKSYSISKYTLAQGPGVLEIDARSLPSGISFLSFATGQLQNTSLPVVAKIQVIK